MIYQVHDRYIDLSRLSTVDRFDDSSTHHIVRGYALSFDGTTCVYKMRTSALDRREQELVEAAIDRLRDALAHYNGARLSRGDASFVFQGETVNLADLLVLEDVRRKENAWYDRSRKNQRTVTLDFGYCAVFASRAPIVIDRKDVSDLDGARLYRDHAQLLGAWTGYHYRPAQGAA